MLNSRGIFLTCSYILLYTFLIIFCRKVYLERKQLNMEEEEESSISELTEADTADTPLEPCPETENWKVP
jgi:hypothetical protein